MKKTIFMIAFLIGLTLSFTHGNNYTPIYNNVFNANHVPIENLNSGIQEEDPDLLSV